MSITIRNPAVDTLHDSFNRKIRLVMLNRIAYRAAMYATSLNDIRRAPNNGT